MKFEICLLFLKICLQFLKICRLFLKICRRKKHLTRVNIQHQSSHAVLQLLGDAKLLIVSPNTKFNTVTERVMCDQERDLVVRPPEILVEAKIMIKIMI